MTHPPIPDSSPPDKRLQFVSHAGLLYVTHEDGAYYLRTMSTHKVIAFARDLYDLRERGEQYVEAFSA